MAADPSQPNVEAGTTPVRSEADYPDRIDLGNGYVLRVDLPDGAGVAPTSTGTFIVLWKGRDLSGLSGEETQKVMVSATDADISSGDASVVLLRDLPCENADTYRNDDSSVDAVSPLNGQPLSYETADIAEKIRERSAEGPETRGLDDFYGSVFILKLGGSPCKAVVVGTMKARGAPAGPLKDLPYQVLVEGEGILTGPQ